PAWTTTDYNDVVIHINKYSVVECYSFKYQGIEPYIHPKVHIFSDEYELFIVKLAVFDKTMSLYIV
ncbi:MAG: hypothetical protein K0S24_2547, partial [Sphingobacterium sp.]|nr:hypothetical protein [Sphingobacterium sp.]